MADQRTKYSRSRTAIIKVIAIANLLVLMLMALAQVSLAAGSEPVQSTSSPQSTDSATQYVSSMPSSGLTGFAQASASSADSIAYTTTTPTTSAVSSEYARDYYWTWYDFKGMQSWVLLANPSGSGTDLNFDLSVAGSSQTLADSFGLGAGVAGEGNTLAFAKPGMMNGPVKASSLTGDKAVVSQRSLMGNSFEEVPGTDAEKLSDHFYWTWYDQKSPGYTDWVLIANPGDAPVYYEITIGGNDPGEGSKGTIEPGKNATPTFPGQMGGPLEVRAWTDTGKATPAKVMASQRVLSNYGTAFNEVPGIPAEELKDHYLWTWYDSIGSAGMDWVLIANPDDQQIYYEITLAGEDPGTGSKGTIDPGQNVTPTFPNKRGGPLEVRTWTDDTKATPANTIASQRVVWGPSFEEVPGYPQDALASDYHWTWYDQQSPGATNWVLAANPNDTQVYYEITLSGQALGQGSKGTIEPGKNVTLTFPGKMAGPLEVKAWTDTSKTSPANIMVSQRVTWNGYFNEVLGTVLNPPLPPVIPETTKVLDDATSDHLSGVSEDGSTLTFTGAGGDIDPVSSLAPGDVIIVDPTTEAPNGALRKVEGVDTSGGQTTVTTSQGTLEDAIEEGTIDMDTETLITPAQAQALPANVVQTSSLGLGTYTISLDKDLYDKNGVKVTAAGSISVEPGFDLECDIKWHGIQRFKFVDKTTETSNLKVTATGEASLFSEKIKVYEQYLTPIDVQVGPVPVIITPIVRVYVGADGSVYASVSTSVTQQADFSAGLEYDHGNWRTISSFHNQFSFQPPTFAAGAKFKAYARPSLDIMIYGVVGPYVYADAYLRADVNILGDPWWKIYGGLDAGAGVKIEVLSFKLGYEHTFNLFEWPIAHANNVTDPPPPPPPPPPPTNNGPTVTNVQPSGTINASPTTISADYSDPDGINTLSATVSLDGNVLSGCNITATSVSCPVSGLAEGEHTINGSLADQAGNTRSISGYFTVSSAATVTPMGYIGSLAISANFENDHTIFAGSGNGGGKGVYKSSDGGLHWIQANNGLTDPSIYPSSMVTVAISPNFANDGIVFAALSNTGSLANGVYRSNDGGVRWRQVLFDGSGGASFAVSPDFAVDHTIFAGTGSGIRKSTDGGNNWNLVSTNISATSLAISPNYGNDHTLFAGAHDSGIPEWPGGIFKSTDGGQTWTPVNNGIGYLDIYSMAISPSYSNDNTIFATKYGLGIGVYRSTDGGQNWSRVYSNQAITSVAISPNFANDKTIFAGYWGGSHIKSTDGGQNWSFTYTNYDGFASLAISPNFANDNTIFAGTFLWGIIKSTNGGDNWMHVP